MTKLVKLPGLIDIHVHLRDPDQTHKEDFYTGTAAALAGGVTAVFDMPNKNFHMLSSDELERKMSIARAKSVCDWGLYFGTDGNNIMEFGKVSDKVAGLKIYLEPTTGHTLIGKKQAESIFTNWPKHKMIVIHTEEAMADFALDLAGRLGNKIHITHINTGILLEKVLEARKMGIRVTCDTTPHHLFLTDEYEKAHKGYGGVKPPLASQKDQDYLWDHIKDIDIIATDHAPHLPGEKESADPPTGIPELDTLLPLMINSVMDKRLTIEDLIRLTNANPQKIFGFIQDKQTFVEADTDTEYEIKAKDLKTKCGWTPYEGWIVRGKVNSVVIRGEKVYEKGNITVKPGFGLNIFGN